MKSSILAVSLMLLPLSTLAAEGNNWGYSGDIGPESWAELSSDNVFCKGKNQSPVNLTGFTEAHLAPLEFHYATGKAEISHLGHTIKVATAAGSYIVLDGEPFELKQFHFHTPAENLIEGKSYPLEGHLVHVDKNGNLAVVAVMFAEGAASPILSQILSAMRDSQAAHIELSQPLSAEALLPADKEYFRFSGSLTTPPCSEGVRWLVMKQPMTASKEQINALAEAVPHANNRPVQPLNGRPVLQ